MQFLNQGFFTSLLAKFYSFVFALGLFVHFLTGTLAGTVYVQQNTPMATSTPAIGTTTASTSAANTAATNSPQAKALAHTRTAIPIQKQTATKVVTTPATPAASVPTTLDLASVQANASTIESLNAIARGALVNILCTTSAGGSFNPISGSGVFIDNRGIILTNAHVAQYFLLKDYPFPDNIKCVIRSGSPAQPLYTAEVMYLPPEWVAANAGQLTATHAQGTGENDYAFLRITGTVSPSISLPTSFPALPMTSDAPQIGAPTLLVAYPAGLLDGETIQMNLYSSSAVSTVQALYSFSGTQNVDLIALSGSVVSQTGSSGGALIGLGSGKLLGIIATETTGTTTADRQLNAVTVGFIDRALAKEGFGGLISFLSGDPLQMAASFQSNIAPQEISQLEAVLNKVSN
jgi:hypothetical protein